jgi:tRNA(Ile)-lysidine synthase
MAEPHEHRDRAPRRRPLGPDPVRKVLAEVARAAVPLGLRGHTVAVAASGGLDSTVLAHALGQGAGRGGFRVALAHVHHGLRGDDADADQAAVEALAEQLGVPCGVERIAPQTLREGVSSRHRPTVQEAARWLRYAALGRLAARWGAQRIATGHHADDQAETVLLRLLRGSGPDGIGGIPERSPDGRIVRPLLRLPRAALLAYAERAGLAWREDASNASERYPRNRLRRTWIPGLAADFNPRLLRALADLAEAQRRDSEWIRGCVEREVRARFAEEGSWLRIDTSDWPSLPEALSRRLIRAALVRAGAGRHVERIHLERIASFLAKPCTGRRIELPGGIELRWTRAGALLGPLGAGSAGRGETVC